MVSELGDMATIPSCSSLTDLTQSSADSVEEVGEQGYAGLPLGTEAPVMMPNGVDYSFFGKQGSPRQLLEDHQSHVAAVYQPAGITQGG